MTGRSPEDIWEDSLDEGQRRLERRLPGLAASSFAGGADIMFGIVALSIATAGLKSAVPEPAAHVLASVALGLGFAFITIGRAELFTENFLIPVGTVVAGRATVGRLVWMWAVALVVNFIGLAFVAALFAVDGVLKPETYEAAGTLADTLGGRTFLPALISAVIAGAVMTLYTWVVAAADGAAARILLSLFAGFLLAAPSLNHAVVGFGEMILGLFAGTADSDYVDLVRNTLIAIAGNVIGGVGLVFSTRITQVRSEPNSDSGGTG